MNKKSAICEKCGAEEHFEYGMTPEEEQKVRDGGDGRWLCNDCWHGVRYTMPPFYARRVKDGYTPPQTSTYLKHETEAWALELKSRGLGKYESVPADNWFGDRIAHPGFGAKRRAAILAEHPEYAR